MGDRPILFSAPMVRALLDGRKTQTRRIMKPQPPTREQFKGSDFGLCPAVAEGVKVYSVNDIARLPKHPTKWDLVGSVGVARDAGFSTTYNTRHAIGDRLWVRETWRTTAALDDTKPADMPPDSLVSYDADYDQELNDGYRGKTRVAIHMPRWASRLTLTVTDVRVQRLQEISHADAIAEGLEWVAPTWGVSGLAQSWSADPWQSYAALWNSINRESPLAANPWIVAVTFTVERRNIDA